MPSMPQSISQTLDSGYISSSDFVGGMGLSKREYFAGLAMQGCWWELTDAARPQHFAMAAESCVAMADALLAELEKQP
mgnify:FL=1